MRNSILLVVVFLLGGAGVAFAQNPAPWDGFYFGANAGAASAHACSSWSAAAAADAGLTNHVCSSGGDPVIGAQFGDNFEYHRLVFGLGADIDLWDTKSQSQALKYAGGISPAGTYTESGRLAPRAFGIIAPRIGYGGDTWLPYVRAGALVTGGSRSAKINYTQPSAVTSTASFSSGKNYSSTGWVAGGGTEIGLNGAGSITLEFLHASLGKGSDFSAACAGTVTACSAFSGITVDSVHDRFTANIFQVGFTYWFSYWNL